MGVEIRYSGSWTAEKEQARKTVESTLQNYEGMPLTADTARAMTEDLVALMGPPKDIFERKIPEGDTVEVDMTPSDMYKVTIVLERDKSLKIE
jgi:translation initiation factor IF-1